MKSALRTVMLRELRALRREVEAYPSDADLWRVAPGIANPSGNLVLHLAGNLQYFVGAVLGGTGYVRHRDAEFGARDAPRRELLEQIDRAMAAVETGLGKLRDGDLDRPYPEPVGGGSYTTGAFLTHLAVHLAYHLGQVDYHRRIVSGDGATVKAVAISELA
ncbi:MAG: DinB family protein [Gemmatimonadales bacterium]|nr:DinB family protein [Gemmatimonadales bacterium]